MGGYIAKIERVSSPQSGSNLWVDLLLDKRNGVFFANVGGKQVSAKSKDEAVELTKKALAAVTEVVWRGVILLRVNERSRDNGGHSRENNLVVYSASCQFTYLRRERGPNPLKPKELIEREHGEDFEARVKYARRREMHFGFTASEKKKRANEAEAHLRQERATLANVSSPWSHFEHTKEYEIPYSPEAWAGIERIARAILETQEKLDNFARAATPERLSALEPTPVRLLLTSK